MGRANSESSLGCVLSARESALGKVAERSKEDKEQHGEEREFKKLKKQR